MRVKMNTIIAGPGGVADAGKPFSCDEKLAGILVSGKFASPMAARGGETAAVDIEAIRQEEARKAREALEAERLAAEQAEAAAKTPDKIREAVAALDPANDEHWTGGGLPSVDAVKELTGSKTLRRGDIAAVAPDAKRPAPVPGQPSGQPSGKDGGSKARSNKP